MPACLPACGVPCAMFVPCLLCVRTTLSMVTYLPW